jgi:hypothetical protein
VFAHLLCSAFSERRHPAANGRCEGLPQSAFPRRGGSPGRAGRAESARMKALGTSTDMGSTDATEACRA